MAGTVRKVKRQSRGGNATALSRQYRQPVGIHSHAGGSDRPSFGVPAVLVSGGPYKPVPPPKPLAGGGPCHSPPPYRMPPYPLYSEPTTATPSQVPIPGASDPTPSHTHTLHTHSSKFPIEREVILGSTEKNSKIPILNEYTGVVGGGVSGGGGRRRGKGAAAVAPDAPSRQLAWMERERDRRHHLQYGQPSPATQETGHTALHQISKAQPIQSLLESSQGSEPSPIRPQGDDTYQSWQQQQNTSVVGGAVPRTPGRAHSTPTDVDGEQGICQGRTESGGRTFSTRTYHTIKDMISSRFNRRLEAATTPHVQQRQQERDGGEALSPQSQLRQHGVYLAPTPQPTPSHPPPAGLSAQQQSRAVNPNATSSEVMKRNQEIRMRLEMERREREGETPLRPRSGEGPPYSARERLRPQPQPASTVGELYSRPENLTPATATHNHHPARNWRNGGGTEVEVAVQQHHHQEERGRRNRGGGSRPQSRGEVRRQEEEDELEEDEEEGGMGGGGAGGGQSDSGRGSTVYSSGKARTERQVDTSPEPLPTPTPGDGEEEDEAEEIVEGGGGAGEWVDIVETELRQILEPKGGGGGHRHSVANSTLSESISSVTPPLPPLSPCGSSDDDHDDRRHRYNYKGLSYGRPSEYNGKGSRSGGRATLGLGTPSPWGGGRTAKDAPMRTPNLHHHHQGRLGKGSARVDASASSKLPTGLTCSSLELDSVADENNSSDEMSTTAADTRAIRKQLEGLESMYSEVLKLLGVRKQAPAGGGGGSAFKYQASDPRVHRRRLYGSLSSLPSSASSRPVTHSTVRHNYYGDRGGGGGGGVGGRQRHDERKKVKDLKGINKRFQRLESHVVTLARSVAHLSSEMRTQHLMIQEMEVIRGELASLRTQLSVSVEGNPRSHSLPRVLKPAAGAGAAADQANSTPDRVKRLTKFFGDEPPLMRLFLKKLGYEKYASTFEGERIGLVELPYLSEERLHKLGIPLGPRLRILQEAQSGITQGIHDNTLCIV